jgi:surface protein
MFENCKKFNCDLNNWDTSSVLYDDKDIFIGCDSLKNIPSWYND